MKTPTSYVYHPLKPIFKVRPGRGPQIMPLHDGVSFKLFPDRFIIGQWFEQYVSDAGLIRHHEPVLADLLDDPLKVLTSELREEPAGTDSAITGTAVCMNKTRLQWLSHLSGSTPEALLSTLQQQELRKLCSFMELDMAKGSTNRDLADLLLESSRVQAGVVRG